MDIADRTSTLKALLQERILVIDGAMGTAIQDLELGPEDFGGAEYEGCNEYLVVSRPDVVAKVFFVLVDSDEEYLRTFRRVGELSEGQEGMHHILGGVPVQMFPSSTKPLFRDTLDQALPVRFGSLRSKFASAEHLILLYLEPFREKDRLRIMNMMPNADIPKLRGLMKRYDDEKGTLTRRLQELYGTGFP